MSNEKQMYNSYHKGAVRPRLNIRRVTGALFIMLVISSCASINPFAPIEKVKFVSEISPGTYSGEQAVSDIDVEFKNFDYTPDFVQGFGSVALVFQTGDIEISNKFGRDIEYNPSDVRLLVVIEGTLNHDYKTYKELGLENGDSYRYISYLEGSDNIELFFEGYKVFGPEEMVPYSETDFLAAGTIPGRESVSGKIAFVPVLQFVFYEAVDMYDQEYEISLQQADASQYLTSNLVKGESVSAQLVSDYELLAEYGEYYQNTWREAFPDYDTSYGFRSYSNIPSVDIYSSDPFGISESTVTNAYGVLLATIGNEVFEIPLDLDFYIEDNLAKTYSTASLPVVQ